MTTLFLHPPEPHLFICLLNTPCLLFLIKANPLGSLVRSSFWSRAICASRRACTARYLSATSRCAFSSLSASSETNSLFCSSRLTFFASAVAFVAECSYSNRAFIASLRATVAHSFSTVSARALLQLWPRCSRGSRTRVTGWQLGSRVTTRPWPWRSGRRTHFPWRCSRQWTYWTTGCRTISLFARCGCSTMKV